MKVIQLPQTDQRWNSADIKKIVAQLPTSFEEVKFHIKGSVLAKEIEAKNKELKPEDRKPPIDKEGRPLNPDLVYKVAKPQRINHTRRIRRAYKKGGQKGVIDYLTWFNKHHATIIKRFPDFFKITTNTELIKRNA